VTEERTGGVEKEGNDDDLDDMPPTGGFRASRDRTLDLLAKACRDRNIAEVQRLAAMTLTWK
jgi:hypothetical protein